MSASKLTELALEEKSFLGLLEKAISFSEKVQNNPPDHVPQEDLVADSVIEYLAPHSGDNGPLEVRKVTYVEGRSNLIVKYRGTEEGKIVSFVGSHMDVVPANPEEWSRDPFTLEHEEGKVYGRGVTDCLGHVCMGAEFLRQLAIAKPVLKNTVVFVFIANEENSTFSGIGIDELEKQGELEALKNGPLFWVDSANYGPTLGTGGMLAWKLKFSGKKFHSGVPQLGINPIEMAMEAVRQIQHRFYEDFQKHNDKEKEYNFAVGSSIKPTQFSTSSGSINQIPGECTVSGDVRHTPFYSGEEVMAAVEKYVKELDVTSLRTLGHSKFHLPEEDKKGTIVLEWLGEPNKGIAVDLKSPGYKALLDALNVACADIGGAKPFSLTGSLPIIRDLQDSGFDVQICGFGSMEAYHAVNEYAEVKAFHRGFKTFANVINNLE